MRRIVAALAALLLLVVGTVVLLAYVNGADARALAGVRTVDVLVAAQAIPEGTAGDQLDGLVRTEAVHRQRPLRQRLLHPVRRALRRVELQPRRPAARGLHPPTHPIRGAEP